MGDDGVLLLIEAAKGGDTDTAEAAVFGLGHSRNILAVVPLQELLENHIRSIKDIGTSIMEDACEEIIKSPQYSIAERIEVYSSLKKRCRDHSNVEVWWLPRKIGSALGSLASSSLKKKVEL